MKPDSNYLPMHQGLIVINYVLDPRSGPRVRRLVQLFQPDQGSRAMHLRVVLNIAIVPKGLVDDPAQVRAITINYS